MNSFYALKIKSTTFTTLLEFLKKSFSQSKWDAEMRDDIMKSLQQSKQEL